MVGRKPKIIPAGSTELRITVPNETVAFLEAQASMLNMPIGRLVRRAVEAQADLLPRLEAVEKQNADLQELVREIRASLRSIATFQAAAVRDLEAYEVADDVAFEDE